MKINYLPHHNHRDNQRDHTDHNCIQCALGIEKILRRVVRTFAPRRVHAIIVYQKR